MQIMSCERQGGARSRQVDWCLTALARKQSVDITSPTVDELL